MRVMTVFGTRPEAIKMAPIIHRLREVAGPEAALVCVTGQHREMLAQALSYFGIVPDHDLDVMRHHQSPLSVASEVLRRLEPILVAERPDWVLVQGDTTSAMAASLAAAYLGLRVGHVEAGLRTGDNRQPFPEEINRRITGVVADLHFAPTERARANLVREGESEATILVTGNPVIDALHIATGRPYDVSAGPLAGVPAGRRVVLVTAHRRENFGAPMRDIFGAVRDLALRYAGDVHVICPVHPNPDVRCVALPLLEGAPNVTVTEPLEYHELVHVMARSTLVLTDSGGIQEEAPSLGKPVLVLREVTERPEAVDAGTVRLVGSRREDIVQAACVLLDDADAYAAMARAVNPYGDGHAAERIVAALQA